MQVAAEIENGRPVTDLSESIKENIEIDFESKWWLASFFSKHGLSFTTGAFLIYLLKVGPSLIFLPLLFGRVEQSFINAYVSSFFGDLYIPISFILINSVHKSLRKMTKKVSEDLRDNRFVAPRSLITEKELESVDEMEKLDTEYRNRYVKPIMMKTLQLGVKLPFDLSYQSGSGAFAAILYGFLMFLGYVVRILPEGMIRVTDLGSQSVTWTSMGITFYGIGMDWFIIGLSTWTLFTTLLCAIQASGNPLKVRPFELMKERFNPLSELILKMTITVTFVVAWASPFIMLWSILPPDPLSRQYAVYFTEVMLTILIPIIVASFVIPSFAVHKGLIRSRDRLLFIKDFELDAIKKIRESEPDKYIKIQQHLISDYKDIQSNSPWLFNFSQVLQLAVSVVLPIVSFWLTIQLK